MTSRPILKPRHETCTWAGCTAPAEHVHHIEYWSEGGSSEPNNLQDLCAFHHRALHASREDWSRWGRKGGQKQTEHLTFLFSLKQYRDNPAARLAWIQEHRPELYETFLSETCGKTA